ncbi:MAG: glycosyltransferase family 39 protein [Actinobacteria bacterium]|nr:glycosyltransferase family 39 protein [Actinomycetota bacterium]
MRNFIRSHNFLIKFLLLILLILIFIRPVNSIVKNFNAFFDSNYSERYDYLKKTYYSSQYVNKNMPNIIPDQAFEAFLGGAFIRGGNPILFVHEHPPMGRYIIGISILIFNNDSTVILPLMLISVLGIFFIAKIVLQNSFLSLIPLAIFVNEPLFISKLEIAPLIEPIQLTFIILSIYFFIKGAIENKYGRYFMLSSTMLGFVISIRFFILGAALVFAMMLYFFIRKKLDKRFIIFLFSLPVSLIILILSYTKTIQEGYSIPQVFSIQKYIFFYHKSKLMSFFSFWDLIMFNRWHTWWGDRRILTDSNWLFLWPVCMVLSFLHIVFAIIKAIKFSDAEKIIILWIFSYSALLSVGYSTTRYFLPLLPFIYIIATSIIVKIIVRVNPRTT